MLNKLVLTKINPPQPRQLLSRPRLLAYLERSRDYRLVLISAGTGFGKTTLLTDFARKSDMALAWYALDESDRDPAVFCRYLLMSVRQIYPQFGLSFEELLEQNLKELHHEAIVFRLAEEFITNLEQMKAEMGDKFQPTLLVLDDFQFAESFGVNRFMQRLIWWLPEGFHIIIATRALPDDLMITRLTAKQMMIALGPRDMAFTTSEVGELLNRFYDIHEPQIAETLAAYSEGWITAVILALSNASQNLLRSEGWRSLKASPSGFDADRLFEYLAQEVYADQQPEIQDFLVRTSVFDLLSAETCAALLSGSLEPSFDAILASESILKRLEIRNLFITRLNDEGQVYFQYHTLFRQFLRSKLRQDKQLYYQTHLRAAQIQKDAGNYTEAVRHYIAADEVRQAAILLNEVIERLYDAGRVNVVAELLDCIPAHIQSNLPHLLYIKARLFLEHGDNEAALQTYKQAEQVYNQQKQYDYAAHLQAGQAHILVRVGQRSQAVAISNRVLQNQQDLLLTSEGQYAVAQSRQVLGQVATEQGDTVTAESNLREAAEIYKSHQDLLRLAAIDDLLGHLYHNIGRLVRSNIYYERALTYCVKTGNRSREAYCRTSLAINAYLQGHYQQAFEQLDETLNLTVDLNDRYLKLYALAYLGNVYRETERYGKADQTYAEALQLAREGNVRKMELLLLNDQATSLILQNKKQEAQNLIRISLELAEEYDLPERLATSYHNQAWLDYENGSCKKAVSSMEKALNLFVEYHARLEETRAKLGLAIIWFTLSDHRKALTALIESLELAEELGYDPYLPFEMRKATALFEYAARRKVSANVEDFLRRHGFISGLSEAIEQLKDSDEITENDLPEPINLAEHLAQNRKVIERSEENVVASGALLRVLALDGGRVWQGNNEIQQWRMSKSREALFYFLEYKKCSRDELIEALWPDEDFGASPNLLHNTLFHLRKAIAPIELKLSAGRYYLDIKDESQIWYDAGEFYSEVTATLAESELDPNRLTKALNLYKRDFLDQFYSNWSLERQQQLLQLYTSGLEKLARYYEERGQFQIALPVWRQLLIKDSYNEEAHRAAIACLLAMGNKAEARRQSSQCLKALEELDLQPSPETRLLLQKLA